MNNRQKDLAITLLEQNSFVSAAQLAKNYQVSTKTIYSDLKELDDIFLAHHLFLTKVPRHGILIKGEDSHKVKLLANLRSQNELNINHKDYSEREACYLYKLILESDKQSILDLALSFFVSETSVRRDLEKLEHYLLENNLCLSKRFGDVRIKGSEKAIRHFYRTYLISHCQLMSPQEDIKKTLSSIFPIKQVTDICDMVAKSTSLYAFSIPSHLEIYLILDLLIASHRIRRQHYLEETSIEEELKSFEVYPLASELLSQALSLPIERLPDQDIKAICLTILSLGYVTIPDDKHEFHILTNHLIQKVSELSGIDFQADQYLYEKIANHMRPMIYRLKNGIRLENQTTEEIKKRYSILFNIVWLATKTVADNYQIAFLDSEIAFLTIYFQIAVEKIEKPLLIYVICPHGLATSELIVNALKRVISPYDYLKKIDYTQITTHEARKADIIISSVELSHIKEAYILVSPVLSQLEMEKIRDVYYSMVNGNRKTLSVINNPDLVNQSLISDLIGQRIYLHQDCQSLEECIAYLVEDKDTNCNHSSAYRESIMQRESLGSTSVYTGIALPHASPDTVEVSQLSLLTLKNPIQWGANQVRVVMLIAIKGGEEEVYKDALIHIYSKIDNQNFIRKLANAKTKDDFMCVLLGKEA
ncbi:PRD domain/PTS system IIA domain protein [Streptococcus pseudoporcinus]|uniref:PRD domain/PTS system IIA domain protein n=1 Tax=Streptococcus pseudoporcinus TaxID=361101 RepID=A0A4U9ZN11_9STRE|nr:BglG family transcription antiterminator [Streptococcus pseudoporcinus]VTS41576.1 PRD domain/PTS system IIA domain protein [Streptococcus pseudoporcinus]